MLFSISGMVMIVPSSVLITGAIISLRFLRKFCEKQNCEPRVLRFDSYPPVPVSGRIRIFWILIIFGFGGFIGWFNQWTIYYFLLSWWKNKWTHDNFNFYCISLKVGPKLEQEGTNRKMSKGRTFMEFQLCTEKLGFYWILWKFLWIYRNFFWILCDSIGISKISVNLLWIPGIFVNFLKNPIESGLIQKFQLFSPWNPIHFESDSPKSGIHQNKNVII